MHDDQIIAEFTEQAESFNLSAVAPEERTLDALVSLAGPRPDERWLEVACGPGLVSRHLAPVVREVHGVDMTPAMLEVARREAAAAGRCFVVTERDGRRMLGLRLWLGRWRCPG